MQHKMNSTNNLTVFIRYFSIHSCYFLWYPCYRL